jgi:uncharacterized protein involved in exopolysaccharide biosynthesis
VSNVLKQFEPSSARATKAARLAVRPVPEIDGEANLYSLRSLHGLLRRRARLMAMSGGAVLALSLLVAALQSDKYEAQFKLLVNPTRVAGAALADATTARNDVTEAELAAEVNLFRNQELLAQVVEECGLAKLDGLGPEARRAVMARAVVQLESRVRASAVKRTNLIEVKFAARTPELAARVATGLADAYLAKHSAMHRNDRAAEFFASESARYGAEAAAARQRLADFQRENGIAALADEKAAAHARAAELQTQIQQVEAEAREAQERLTMLREQHRTLPATLETGTRTVANGPLADRLRERLIELENQRTALVGKYAPGYRLVKEIDEQIRQTRTSLEREQQPAVVDRTEAPNPLRQSIEGELLHTQVVAEGADARRAGLREQLRQTRARQAQLEGLTGRYETLARDVELADSRFALYRNKQEDLQLARVMDDENLLNVRIVEAATVPSLPVRSNRLLLVMLGCIAAVAAAACTAFVGEVADRPIRGRADLVHTTGLPILATLSRGN